MQQKERKKERRNQIVRIKNMREKEQRKQGNKINKKNIGANERKKNLNEGKRKTSKKERKKNAKKKKKKKRKEAKKKKKERKRKGGNEMVIGREMQKVDDGLIKVENAREMISIEGAQHDSTKRKPTLHS